MNAARYVLTVDVAGFWHSGTGRESGAGADALVARDEMGLPYLPGRHVKGLLRHALRLLESCDGAVEPGTCDRLLGKGAVGASDRPALSRYGTETGRLRFGSARLPKEWRDFAAHAEGRAQVRHLVRTIDTTALDEGVVASRTLRSIEVAVPMCLMADVRADPRLTEDDLRALRLAAGVVRRVGKHRTRGLGRARMSIEELSS